MRKDASGRDTQDADILLDGSWRIRAQVKGAVDDGPGAPRLRALDHLHSEQRSHDRVGPSLADRPAYRLGKFLSPVCHSLFDDWTGSDDVAARFGHGITDRARQSRPEVVL